jgi:MoxR-like ATPase
MKQIATKLGMALINVRVGQLEPGDLIGIPYNVRVNRANIMEYSIPNYLPQYKYDENDQPVLRADGTHALDFERMGEIVQNSKELVEVYGTSLVEVKGAILFLDEINRIAGDDTKQSIFQLPEQYRIHTYKIPEGCVIFAAANPNNNEYQVSEIDGDRAFMDRFLHIKLKARLEDWMVWAQKRGIDANLVSFYNSMRDALYEDEKHYKLNVNPSPRSAELINTLLTEVKLPADDSIRQEVLMGVLGDTYGPMLHKHLRENMGKVLSGEEVVTKYTSLRKYIVDAVKQKRVDYIDQVTRNVYAYLSNHENWDTLDEHEENFQEFLKDLNPEIRMTHVKQLIAINANGESLNDRLGQFDIVFETLKVDANRADGIR